MTLAATTLLEALRAETRSIHEALHVHPLLAPLARADVTHAQYADALTAFDAYYRAMESRRSVAVPEGVPDAAVVDWLARDMLTAGAQTISPVLDWPSVDSDARLWGYLYVKQGSMLGGAVMSKNLNRALGLRPGKDQLFFAGYGTETGAKWKDFIENLFANASLLPKHEIIEMAVASFQAIAATCDAVQSAKASYAVQAASAAHRISTQAGA